MKKRIALIISACLLLASVIGVVVAAETAPKVSIQKATLSYDDSLQVAYALKAENADGLTLKLLVSDKSIEVTVGSDTTADALPYTVKGQVNGNKITDEGVDYPVIFSNGVMATDMRRDIYTVPVLVDEGGIVKALGDELVYSPYTYVLNRFTEGDLEPDQERFYTALLDLGAAAQGVLLDGDEIAAVGGFADAYFVVTSDTVLDGESVGEANTTAVRPDANGNFVLVAENELDGGIFTGFYKGGVKQTSAGYAENRLAMKPGRTAITVKYEKKNSSFFGTDFEASASGVTTSAPESPSTKRVDNQDGSYYIYNTSDYAVVKDGYLEFARQNAVIESTDPAHPVGSAVEGNSVSYNAIAINKSGFGRGEKAASRHVVELDVYVEDAGGHYIFQLGLKNPINDDLFFGVTFVAEEGTDEVWLGLNNSNPEYNLMHVAGVRGEDLLGDSIKQGEWANIRIEYLDDPVEGADNAEISIYVNGIFAATTTYTNPIEGRSDRRFYLGANYVSVGDRSLVRLDNISMFTEFKEGGYTVGNGALANADSTLSNDAERDGYKSVNATDTVLPITGQSKLDITAGEYFVAEFDFRWNGISENQSGYDINYLGTIDGQFDVTANFIDDYNRVKILGDAEKNGNSAFLATGGVNLYDGDGNIRHDALCEFVKGEWYNVRFAFVQTDNGNGTYRRDLKIFVNDYLIVTRTNYSVSSILEPCSFKIWRRHGGAAMDIDNFFYGVVNADGTPKAARGSGIYADAEDVLDFSEKADGVWETPQQGEVSIPVTGVKAISEGETFVYDMDIQWNGTSGDMGGNPQWATNFIFKFVGASGLTNVFGQGSFPKILCSTASDTGYLSRDYDLLDGNGVVKITPYAVFEVGTWYNLRFEISQSGTAGAYTRTLKVFVNGALVMTATESASELIENFSELIVAKRNSSSALVIDNLFAGIITADGEVKEIDYRGSGEYADADGVLTFDSNDTGAHKLPLGQTNNIFDIAGVAEIEIGERFVVDTDILWNGTEFDKSSDPFWAINFLINYNSGDTIKEITGQYPRPKIFSATKNGIGYLATSFSQLDANGDLNPSYTPMATLKVGKWNNIRFEAYQTVDGEAYKNHIDVYFNGVLVGEFEEASSELIESFANFNISARNDRSDMSVDNLWIGVVNADGTVKVVTPVEPPVEPEPEPEPEEPAFNYNGFDNYADGYLTSTSSTVIKPNGSVTIVPSLGEYAVAEFDFTWNGTGSDMSSNAHWAFGLNFYQALNGAGAHLGTDGNKLKLLCEAENDIGYLTNSADLYDGSGNKTTNLWAALTPGETYKIRYEFKYTLRADGNYDTEYRLYVDGTLVKAMYEGIKSVESISLYGVEIHVRNGSSDYKIDNFFYGAVNADGSEKAKDYKESGKYSDEEGVMEFTSSTDGVHTLPKGQSYHDFQPTGSGKLSLGERYVVDMDLLWNGTDSDLSSDAFWAMNFMLMYNNGGNIEEVVSQNARAKIFSATANDIGYLGTSFSQVTAQGTPHVSYTPMAVLMPDEWNNIRFEFYQTANGASYKSNLEVYINGAFVAKVTEDSSKLVEQIAYLRIFARNTGSNMSIDNLFVGATYSDGAAKRKDGVKVETFSSNAGGYFTSTSTATLAANGTKELDPSKGEYAVAEFDFTWNGTEGDMGSNAHWAFGLNFLQTSGSSNAHLGTDGNKIKILCEAENDIGYLTNSADLYDGSGNKTTNLWATLTPGETYKIRYEFKYNLRGDGNYDVSYKLFVNGVEVKSMYEGSKTPDVKTLSVVEIHVRNGSTDYKIDNFFYGVFTAEGVAK